MIAAPKGTKDLLPEQAYKWHYLEAKFKELCERYGFKEIRTPMFEYTELFRRGVGDTTDIVQKEMYTFEDLGGRSISLKPEGTASAVRSFVEHKLFANVQPTKMYYVTPCFRYEKPQAGRLREFHQFGLEIFGTEDMLADAEVISFANDFLTGLGIKNIELAINSVGCKKCRADYRDALREYYRPHYNDLCGTCKERFEKNPMRLLDCKSPQDHELAKNAPSILDYLCEDCAGAFRDLKANLDSLGIEYTIDPSIVRGLDYYTKTAFEFVSTGIGAQSTVCGGGRYDDLIEEIGGPSVPGVGFGLGIERLLILMEENGSVIPEPERTDVFIAVMGDRAKAAGLGILKELRDSGIKAEMDLLARNLKGQLKYAAKLDSRFSVIIGDNELDKAMVQLKDMELHDQKEIPIEDLKKEIITAMGRQ